MSLLLSFFMAVLGVFSFAPNTQCYVTASSCYLYTEASFSAEKVLIDESPVVLKHKDVVVVQSEENDFCLVTLAGSETEGYVYKFYITNNSSQSVYPVFNATIRNETHIYDLDKNQTEYIAVKNQRVYIYEGFNDKKEYTAVQIVLPDGSLFNGYVKTKDLNPDGVSSTLIIAISAISAIVTVVLALVFIKKPKRRKKFGTKS